MHPALHPLVVLLAQATPDAPDPDAPLRRGPMIDITSVSKHFADQREPLIDPYLGIAAIGSAALLVAALALWRHWHRRHERSRPRWLLTQTRHAFNLAPAAARLLRRIAAHRELPHALTLVVSRQTFDLHTTAYLSHHGHVADRLRPRLNRLARQLFAPPPTPAPPGHADDSPAPSPAG